MPAKRSDSSNEPAVAGDETFEVSGMILLASGTSGPSEHEERIVEGRPVAPNLTIAGRSMRSEGTSGMSTLANTVVTGRPAHETSELYESAGLPGRVGGEARIVSGPFPS
jgi:hypothetical protein